MRSTIAFLSFVLAGLFVLSAGSAEAGTYLAKACAEYSAWARDVKVTTSSSLSKFSYEDPCGYMVLGTGDPYPFQSTHNYNHNEWIRSEMQAPEGSTFFGTPQIMNSSSDSGGSFVRTIGATNGNGSDYIPISSFGWATYSTISISGTRNTIAESLRCNQATCVKPTAWVEITDIHDLGVVDYTPPSLAAVGGSILTPGPKSGTQSLTIGGADQQSGISRVYAYVNGTTIIDQSSCSPVLAVGNVPVHPCPYIVSPTSNVDTAAAPFVEGLNQIRVCVSDYSQGIPAPAGYSNAPNSKCDVQYAYIDN